VRHASDMISPAQIRAARAMLGWKREELRKRSGVSLSTIADFETGRNNSLLTDNANKIIRAFREAGIEFTDASRQHGAGVRWIEPDTD